MYRSKEVLGPTLSISTQPYQHCGQAKTEAELEAELGILSSWDGILSHSASSKHYLVVTDCMYSRILHGFLILLGDLTRSGPACGNDGCYPTHTLLLFITITEVQ